MERVEDMLSSIKHQNRVDNPFEALEK